MPKRVTISGLEFSSIAAAERHCRQILHADELDTEIEREHWPILEALLYSRSEKVAELKGRKPTRYLRKMHRRNTQCFFVEFDDGEVLDFSFHNSIKALAAGGPPAREAASQPPE